MPRFFLFSILLSGFALNAGATVVVDAETRRPMASATIFDSHGKTLGMSSSNGHIPYAPAEKYPLRVRYMGYHESTVNNAAVDSVFLSPNPMELRELVVETKRRNVLHIIAYVQETSSLSSLKDTVFLFREKMVDFMLPSSEKMRFKGWKLPRILKSKSYYRFTDSTGLDSVSDRCSHHFSWADWMGLSPESEIPERLRGKETESDTLYGKYSPVEIWTKNAETVKLDVDVLAAPRGRKRVPGVSLFFRDNVDFEQFRLHVSYDNIFDTTVTPEDITGYSFNIESNGRGREMFMFNRPDERFWVNTYAEIYILDKEYISSSEASKWEELKIDTSELEIIRREDVPEPGESIRNLIARVDSIDHLKTRLDFIPDHRLGSAGPPKRNFVQKIFERIKGMTGIDQQLGKRKMNKHWREFRKERHKKNASRVYPDEE